MAVTAWVFANFFETAFDGVVFDYLTDDMGVLLTDNTPYVPDQDLDDFGSDVDFEVSEANGYLSGQDGTGELLLSKTHANTANVSKLDAADPQWTATGAGFTARIVVFLDVATATAATNPLMCWMNFGADETASGGGTFTIALSGSGILEITAANQV